MDDKTLLALFDKFEKSSAAELKYSGNGYNFELRRIMRIAKPDRWKLAID